MPMYRAKSWHAMRGNDVAKITNMRRNSGAHGQTRRREECNAEMATALMNGCEEAGVSRSWIHDPVSSVSWRVSRQSLVMLRTRTWLTI